jgi:outer membrane protein assembly factor BamD
MSSTPTLKATLFRATVHTPVKFIGMVLGLAMLASCSSEPDLSEYDLTEDQFYTKVQNTLEDKRYEEAVDWLEAMEARYPFGKYAEQGQLDLIYANYMQYEHEAARAAAERFIRLHPQHPQVDYAYYLKGLSSFSEGQGLFERFLPTDVTKRDPGGARQSFADFAQMLARYPESRYAPDAKKRMVYLRNLLARYEIHVANYYFKRGAYLAAANRGRYVVENFQRTPAVPDALATMVQAYRLLGLDDLAQTAEETLRSNFPNHSAFDENGNFVMRTERVRSIMNKMSFGMIDPPPPMGFDSRNTEEVKKQRKATRKASRAQHKAQEKADKKKRRETRKQLKQQAKEAREAEEAHIKAEKKAEKEARKAAE